MATNIHIKFYLFSLNIYLILLTTIEARAERQLNPYSKQPPISNRQAGLTPGADDEYLVGFGIADITGPSADINLVSLISQMFEFASELLTSQQGSYAPSFSPGRFSSVARTGQSGPQPVIKGNQDLVSNRSSTSRPAGGGTLAPKLTPSRSPITSRPVKRPTIARPRRPPPPARPPSQYRQKYHHHNHHHHHHHRHCHHHSTVRKKQPYNAHSSRWVQAGLLSKGATDVLARFIRKGLRFRLTDGLMRHANKKQATISLNDRPLMSISYPSWRDLQNMKLQIKVNLNNFLTNTPPMSPRSPPMGYAKPNQDAGGIHLRQFCRSAIIEDSAGTKLVYINLDNGMVSQLLRTQLMKRLHDEYDGVFNESNVMISATHTHSGPGGYFQYMLYNIPSAGYIAQTLEALIDGISRSVGRAYQQMQLARIYFHKGELVDASVNRSPTSYANDPAEERAQYKYDTDKDMMLLRFVDLQGEPIAMINWFAVHGTSMNNSNHLISSDNKGYAALLFEEELNKGGLPGKGKFVAMFAQSNEGDVSPNTRGARCVDTGLPCDLATSTCGNPPRNEKCIASGPGRDMFESTKIIAYKQYYKARQLFFDTTNQRPVRGPIRFIHEYIDVTKQQVPAYKSLVDLTLTHIANNQQQQQQPQQQQTGASRRRSHDAFLVGRRQDHDQKQVGNAQQQPPTSSAKANLPPFYPSSNGTYTTCVAALGYSFAAGTTDGPGAFDFQQGDTASSRYWNMVRNFLRKPSEEQIKCHHPKPILLDTGEMDFPYMWHPKVVPTQIFMIGNQVALVGLPGEFTTMSGRRVRQAVRAALRSGTDHGYEPVSNQGATKTTTSDGRQTQGNKDDLSTDETRHSHGQRQRQRVVRRDSRQEVGYDEQVEVILSGLSNIYTSYITTIEEYAMQRYEGASTLYGPHTLQAYINQFVRLARVLATTPKGQSFELTQASLQPPDLTKSLFTLKAGVIYDGAPHGKNFGDLLADVERGQVYKCRDLVSVAFVAGNPRNDLKQEDSFLYVDKFNPNDQTWAPVFSDASWETKFIWERTNTLFGESKATIQWEIPDECESGVYRIRHLGAHKTLLQTISQYEGKSSPFKVSAVRTTSAEQLQQAEANQLQLEAILKLAQQVEIQSAGQTVALPANPKSDRHLGTSIISGFYNYLSSIFRRRL